MKLSRLPVCVASIRGVQGFRQAGSLVSVAHQSGLQPYSYGQPRPRPVRGRCASSTSATPETLLNNVQSLTPFERASRAVTFWSSVVPILFKYYQTSQRQERGVEVTEQEWDELHEWGSTKLADTINELKGFYVKSGQVMSTRVDLFPAQYTSKLQSLQDSLEPISAALVKGIIQQELLEGEDLSTLFREFDDVPLGSASIAQVHKAVLLDGRIVAVKVQRPAEEPKLRGDIQNLKAFALRFRDSLPVDYYPVFCELERALTNELDFLAEAQSMEKIAAAVAHTADGKPAKPPLYVPRPIPGLCSTRVLVMEYVEGIPLSKLADKMAERGLSSDSPEAKILGRRILESLTEAFARMIFGPGFIHGDPHPGNIFIMESTKGVALIDCGQVKQLPATQKLKLAALGSTLADYGKPGGPTTQALAAAVRDFGVEVEEGAGEDCLAATALLLFGPAGVELPGGYSTEELSARSPLRQLKEFPQELVMMGRATVLIKGIASRLGIKWNLAEQWRAAAQQALECGQEGCMIPVYATTPPPLGGSTDTFSGGRPRFRDVRKSLRGARVVAKEWAAGKAMEMLPEGVRAVLIRRMARKIERETRELESGP